MYKIKEYLYVTFPLIGLLFLAERVRLQKYAYLTISDWMAFDIYPEYAKEVNEIVTFLTDLTSNRSVWDLLKK